MWSFNEVAGNTALINECGNITTYGELQAACDSLTSAINKRCLVFCLCNNEKGSLLGYVAFVNSNIVPVMLDTGLKSGLISILIENYKPDYLWLPDNMTSLYPDYKCVFSLWGYSLIKTICTNVYPLYDELALLLTTSGSTGSPKLVRQSYLNIKANTDSITEYLKLDSSERPITTMPMSYTYGLSIINSHLNVGAAIILTQKTLMQKEFWQQFKEYGATSFGGVPYIYEMLDKLRFYRMELPKLRTMTQAGGKLSPELHRKFAEYAKYNNKQFIVMYGQTEATARMSYLPHEKSLEKYGSMGIAIPGGEFSLIDIDGNKIVKSDIIGELVYKGANVTIGYAECGEDLIKRDEFGGILITGDMAKRDSDGFYYIVGRKKRFLKLFGNRINLDETEQLLIKDFPNVEFACAGKDDKMVIYMNDGNTVENITKFIADKTGINHAAFKVVFIEEIPRNESGKIQYSELNKFDD